VIDVLINFVSIAQQLLFWLVIISVILSYFMDPFHPVRRTVDGIVQPLLAPIRRIVPLVGMLDFSPFILLLLIQFLGSLLIRFLITLR
jgi:YggT family protein